VLLELNTGLPFALRRSDLAGVDPSRYVATLLAKVASVSPDIDPRGLENIQAHCGSMRDDLFVKGPAAELDRLL
jgi:hypothetical protein